MKTLFKGKTPAGEWVEGDLIQSKRGVSIAPNFYDSDGNSISIRVLPETVCQYTGLNDKNGKLIFSGDKFFFNGEVRYIEYIDDRCRYVLTNGSG